MGTLSAGSFARWLQEYLRAQTQPEAAGEVPCGDCNACCKASYFIEIEAQERETLARIPRVHLTLSTRSPEQPWTLEQSCNGRCPMLVDERCAIYTRRPRTCRRFDCRVFAATSIAPGAGSRPLVNQQVWRWRFDYPSATDSALQTAVLAAAAFLQRRPDLLDPEVAPTDPGELAKAAVLVHELFLQTDALAQSDQQIAAQLNSKLRELAKQAHNVHTTNKRGKLNRRRPSARVG